MPGEKASRLSSTGRWIVEVAKLVLGPAMTFVIAYVVYPEFRAWVSQVVDRVGPLLSVAGGLLANVLAGVLIQWVWGAVRGRVMGRYENGVWAAVRRRVMGWYANGVWVVSKPVRDELAVRFVEHYRSGTGEYAECRAKVRDLSNDAALVLHNLLNWHGEHSGEALYVWVDNPEPPMSMSPLKNLMRDDLKSACDQLVQDKFLAEVEWGERDGGEEMHIVVGKCVAKRSAARRVNGWVDEEMQGRGVWGP